MGAIGIEIVPRYRTSACTPAVLRLLHGTSELRLTGIAEAIWATELPSIGRRQTQLGVDQASGIAAIKVLDAAQRSPSCGGAALSGMGQDGPDLPSVTPSWPFPGA